MSERLTDRELTFLLARVNELGAAWGTTCASVELVITELRLLRAQALTKEEVEALVHIRDNVLSKLIVGEKPAGVATSDIAVLDKLTKAGGG